MSRVLVINSGSSSVKYQLIELDGERRLASGLVERIGEGQGRLEHRVPGAEPVEVVASVADHAAGFVLMVEAFVQHGPSLSEEPLLAIGHRVVQGGKRFFEPTLVNDLVEINIEDLGELAPLHNPGAVQGIRAARAAFADVPHVAVFDTAFHQTIPEAASTYAIDAETAERHRIRRYGFHGTSHKFVSRAAADFLGEESFTGIVLHLGNGASACAIRQGRSIDTSMGMTPLQGLVMGTRSGDVDPAVIIHLQRRAGFSFAQVDDLLNKRSGLLGLAGSGDMRDVRRRADAGFADARRALAVYRHRVRHYLGAYLIEMTDAQAIVFTAGAGENDVTLRAELLEGLEPFGIVIDPERNASPERGARRISTDDSRIAVLVVPTDEEIEIARQAAAAV